MPKITLLDWPELRERLGLVPLSSPELTTIYERELVRDRTYVDPKLTFRGEARATATVFNDLSDEDEHRILGRLPRGTLTTSLPAQIELTEERAWIRYEVAGELVARGKGSLEELKLSIEGRSGVRLLDYRRHQREELLAEAVADDLARPRSPFRAGDILRLEPGDALALSGHGTWKASLTLLWVDVYTNVLSRISATLGGRVPIALRTDSRATITIPVSIEDDLLLAFSRDDDGAIRIALKKESIQSRGARVRVAASVKLARRGTIAAAVVEIVTAVLGAPLARVEEILKKATLEDLDEEERAIIEVLLEQLGLSDDMAALEELRDFVAGIEDRAMEAIEESISQRIEASFQYEYARIAESDDLLNVVVHRDGLTDQAYARLIRRHHRGLIRGELTPLLDAIREDPQRYTLQQYLNRDRIVATHAYGFTLGIGDWRFRSRETSRLAHTTRTDLEGRKMIAFDGLRRHREDTGSFGGMEWSVDFRAAMREWASEPRAADFDFGLHFLIEWRIDRFNEARFLRTLDMALLWRAVRVKDASWALAQARPHFGSRGVRVLLGTMFEEDHLRRILPLVDAGGTAMVAEALAAALPFDAHHPILRAPLSRAIGWGELVREALEGTERSRPQIHRAAAQIADALREPSLAALERAAAKGGAAVATLPGSVLALHPKLPYAWSRFAEGARLLSEALDSGTMHHRRIPEIFRGMQRFWDHAWYVRALPAYLQELAAHRETAAGIQRTFRLDIDDVTLHLVR